MGARKYWTDTAWQHGVLLVVWIAAVGGQIQIIDPVQDKQTVPPGGTATFKCVSSTGDGLVWQHMGLTISSGGRRNINTVRNIYEGTASSTLTVVHVEHGDAGAYRCKNDNDDILNVGVIKYLVVSDSAATEIFIDGPSEITVIQGQDLYLKCDAAAGQDHLLWKHNGDELQDRDGHETITVSRDYRSNRRKALLTRSNMDAAKQGEYQCFDPNTGRSASVVVTVANSGPLGGNMEILEPLSNRHKLDAGSTIIIKCRHDLGTDVIWYKDNTRIQNTGDGFLAASSTENGFEMSLLTKDGATVSDSGNYRCQNARLSSDYQEISITVEEIGGAAGAAGAVDGSESESESESESGCLILSPTYAVITLATVFLLATIYL